MANHFESLSKANRISARFQLKVMSDQIQNVKEIKNYSFAITESYLTSDRHRRHHQPPGQLL